MVSYYNPLAMYSKSHCANLYPPSNHHWYSSNYHQPPPNSQLGATGAGLDGEGQPPMYYTHPMFHQGSPDWPSHDSFPTPPSANGALSQASIPGNGGNMLPNAHHHHLHHLHQQTVGVGLGSTAGDSIADGLHAMPSPPITVSGSEMSSPGGNGSNNNISGLAGGSSSPLQTSIRPTPAKSPYEWIKRTSYQNQTNPGKGFCKTRTKDKYRVVYTDYQRLELEKEYHTSRYITIRRKTELAQALALSERQVKIWFQNRRAKERKQTKKRDDPSVTIPQQGIIPKTEPGLHIQHPALHQMSAMGMTMGLHHHHHPH